MHTTATRSDLHYFSPNWIVPTREVLQVDICVYGGTASGVVAAVKASRLGRRVVLLQPGRHLGGLTSGGLGWTDFGKRHVIGGMSRQFYAAAGQAYGKPAEWQFEPHVAEAIMNHMVAEAQVPVRRCQYLSRVEMNGRRLAALEMLGGLRVEAAMFIDASYEGDLMASAGVSFTVGREANAQYGETLNGIQVRHKHQFSHPVDPYVESGNPASGLLPGILAEDLSARIGAGDTRIQAYCFRMCMTDDPAIKLDWPRPEGYDPRDHELATRWFNGEKDAYNDQLPGEHPTAPGVPWKFDVLPNRTPGGYHKTDTNNHGPVSSDFIGQNHAWPEADYAARETSFQRHVTYQQGFYWHMANAAVIPLRYREAYRRWGLPQDEFLDTGHWPHQLYIREARRLVADEVLTEHHCRQTRRVEDPVGMGSYGMDSHNCARFVRIEDGRARVMNDGDVQVATPGPYGVSYRSIVPRRGECENLLIPVCLSASHIAYGSVRMEPVFMVLGESAAVAAHLALDQGCPLQELPYASLRPQLEAAGQVLAL